MAQNITWAEALRQRTAPGELYRPLDKGWVQCYACGHECKIPPGRPGICQVRFNDNGTLRVPYEYVAALIRDPIEKKPFFHALPGTDAMSFGMLGCDLHCAYCFPGDTLVVTDQGPISLGQLFDSAPRIRSTSEAVIAFPAGRRAVAGSGTLREIRGVFKHRYHGPMAVVRPYYLPPLRCAPDHRVYATDNVASTPRPIQARQLTAQHYLVVPRRFAFASRDQLEVWEHLRRHSFTYRVGHLYDNGKVGVTTVSRELACGIAWLSLKLGHWPSLYETTVPEDGMIQGRVVRRAPHQYTVVWYEDSPVRRELVETEDMYLVPIRGVSCEDFEGDVYNMEVAEEHNYLAGFFLVSNCQNWETSQALRDPEALAPPRSLSADEIVQQAVRCGSSTVASTYNEPLITSEWAVEVFKKAKQRGLKTAFISNGNGTPEVLEYLRPWVDLYKVDLKSFSDRNYRQLGGRIDRILDTIPRLVRMGFWVEIVTLIIPGFNDSDQELTDIARYLAGISADIPWHVTAFHKDYRMTDPDNTPASTLLRAHAIGRSAGLHYVYPGNLPGRVGPWEHTYCPNCHQAVIERYGFSVLRNGLAGGKCPQCATVIAGIWN